MAEITNPGTNATEFAGEFKLLSLPGLALTAATDTITLTAAANGITTIQNVVVCPAAGVDAAYSDTSVTWSGLVITISSWDEAGTVATDWTGATCNVIIIGS